MGNFIYEPNTGTLINEKGDTVSINLSDGYWNITSPEDSTRSLGVTLFNDSINGIPLYNGRTPISEEELLRRLEGNLKSKQDSIQIESGNKTLIIPRSQSTYKWPLKRTPITLGLSSLSFLGLNPNFYKNFLGNLPYVLIPLIEVTPSVSLTLKNSNEKPKLYKKPQKPSISYFNDVSIQKNWKGKEGEIDLESLDKLRLLGINTTNAREALKALNKFIKNSKLKGRIAVDNKWGTLSRTVLEDLWKEYVFGLKVFNTPVTVLSNQPALLINPGQERMKRMTPQTQQTWGLSNVPNELVVVVQPAIDAVGLERMSRMSPEALLAWGYYKKGGVFKFQGGGTPTAAEYAKYFDLMFDRDFTNDGFINKDGYKEYHYNIVDKDGNIYFYTYKPGGYNVIGYRNYGYNKIGYRNLEVPGWRVYNPKTKTTKDVDTSDSRFYWINKTPKTREDVKKHILRFATYDSNYIKANRNRGTIPDPISKEFFTPEEYDKQQLLYKEIEKYRNPKKSETSKSEEVKVEPVEEEKPVEEKPTNTATKSNDKKTGTTAKVSAPTPISKWFNNYGLTRTNNRNISELELAQLKEMGFTGSSTDDAQQFLNDWIKAKKYSEAGEAAGLIKKDGYWGGLSLKSLAELYSKFNSNKPKPEAVVEVKTELPTKPVLKPIQLSAVINPGTYNTSTVYDDNYVRGFRNNGFNNITDYWNYIQGDNEHSKLWNNIFNGLSPYLKRLAYDLIMKQYGISGNLGWRDSRRLADLLNDLNLIGMNGSPTRNSYLSAVRSRYVPSSPYRESFTNYRPTAVSVSSGLDTQLVPRTVLPNLVVEVPTQEELYNKAIGLERVSRLSPEARLQQGYYKKGGLLNFIRVVPVTTLKTGELIKKGAIGFKSSKPKKEENRDSEFILPHIEQTSSLYTLRLPLRTKSIEELNESILLKAMKKVLGDEKARDIHGVLFAGDYSIDLRLLMLKNGLLSKLGIGGGDTTSQIKSKINLNDTILLQNQPKDTIISQPLIEVKDTTVLDPLFASESRYGDTIKVDKDFYMIPESINLNNVKLGYRNRGSREPFNTKGGLIPTYKPITTYELGEWVSKDRKGNVNHFFGYDKDGNIKVGPLENFGPGDTMTLVFYDLLLNIPKDNNGKYLYGPGTKNPNNRRSPIVDLRHENGNSYRGPLLIMTGHKNKGFNPNVMEMAGGGAYIVKVDNELRLIRGSVNNVMQELELIRKNHKNSPMYLYLVDNGSYNRGLRPYDNNYSSEELKKYDAQNTDYEPGGHFFYIK